MPPRQKGRHRNKKGNEHHEHHDMYHNGDIPCCRLLQDFSTQVLSDSHQESLSLASIFRQHLIQRQQRDQDTKSSTNAKKKRKKRKKKKTAAATTAGESTTTAASMPEAALTTADVGASEEAAPAEKATAEASLQPQPQELSQSSSMRTEDREVPAASTDSLTAESIVKNFLNRELVSETTTSNNHSLQAFLETLKLSSFQITQEQIRLATAAIQCVSCRRWTEDILEVEHRVSLQRLQELQSPKDVFAAVISSNDETAFDYVAMEEGNGIGYDKTTEEPAMYFQLVSEEESTAGWQFRKSDGTSLTMDDLEFLLNEYLILACIHPDRLMNSHELSDNYMASLVVSVDSRCTNILNDFRDFAQEIQRNVTKLHNSSQNSESNIDMKSFSIMQEVDEFLCSLMAKLLRLLLEVTRAFQSIADATNGNTDHTLWGKGRITDCWDAYFQSMGLIFDAMSNYEQQLFALADRQGVVPKMFVSSTARNLFYQSVNAKLQAAVKAVEQTQRLLDHQLVTVDSYIGWGWTVRFLRKLFTYEAFYKVVAGAERGNHRSQSAMDLACEDVLYTVCEWVETVHQSSVSKIMDVHHRRRDKMNRLLGTAGEHLFAVGQSERLGKTFSSEDLSRMRQDVFALRECPAGDEDEVECSKVLRLELVPKVFKMVNLWTASTTVNGASETVQSAVMPLNLTKWMVHETLEDSSSCQGQAGSVRAACILAGLFFRGMSDRCKEWLAKLAEEELLTTMADAERELEASAAKGSKASKKKRKKKPAVNEAKDSMGAPSIEGTSSGIPSFDSENHSEPDVEREGREDSTEQRGDPSFLSGESISDNVVENTPPATAEGGAESGKTKRPAVSSKEPLTEAKAELADMSTETHALGSVHSATKEAKSKAEKEKLLADSTVGSQANHEELSKAESAANDVEDVPSGGSGLQPSKKPKRVNKAKQQNQRNLSRENARTGASENASANKQKKNKADGVEGTKKADNGQSKATAESNLDQMVKVGVYSKSSFQSAEDFLLGRLVAVLNSSKKGKQDNVTIL